MKKLISLSILITSTIGFSQITTIKVAEKKDNVDNSIYDSTQNFLGDNVFKYIGQELYLKGQSESLRKYGYDNFLLDYTKEKGEKNTYKCCDGFNSKYNDITNKYFVVLDVIKSPKAKENETLYGRRYFLKLKEKESNDIVYYQYDSKYDKHSFPFIVVGFFDKQKKLLLGKSFVFADKTLKKKRDINTGKEITIKTGDVWICKDLTIEEVYFSLSVVVENSLGENTTIMHGSVSGEYSYGRSYEINQAEDYKNRFGKDNFTKILEGNVSIGMTKEMCKLSWGEPTKINETINSNGKTEQWVYSNNYLYFDGDKLTTIQ
jgi:hypothetical protein